MNFKRIIAMLCAAALCLSLFAGCAETAESESTTEGTESTEPAMEFKTEFDLSQYLDSEGFIKDYDFDANVSLNDYKSMVIPAEHHTPTEAAVEELIYSVLYSFGSYEQLTSGTVTDGATLNIDYVGKIDGVEFDGGSTGGFGTEVTIGYTSYIDDFLEQLVGKEIGSTFDIEVTFPEDYGVEELNGKDAVFTVTVNYMNGEYIVPELTDDFVAANLKTQYSCETAEEFRDMAEEAIAMSLVSSYVYDEIISNCTVELVGDNALNLQKDYTLANEEAAANSYGYSLDDYLNLYYGLSRDQLLEEYADVIERNAKEILILQAIAKQEGFAVTEEMIVDYFGTEDYSYFEDVYGMPFIKFLIIQSEIIDMLENDTPRA